MAREIFWELARKKKLLRETREYVPKILAAMAIGENPGRYGFVGLNYQQPFSFDSVFTAKPVSLEKLAKHLGLPYKDLKKMNPRYRSDYVPVTGGQSALIRVPKGSMQVAYANLTNSVSSRPSKPHSDFFYYRIRRGDNLSTLARRYGTRVSVLRRLNGLSRRSLLRVGKKLRIPERGYRVSKRRAKRKPSSRRHKSHATDAGVHVVRRGENLSVIAKRYGTSVRKLRRLNRLGRRSMIRVGQRIRYKDKPSSSTKQRRSRVKTIHVVRRGENLIRIAKRYQVSLGQLTKVNKLRNRSKIFVGRRLVIPDQASLVR